MVRRKSFRKVRDGAETGQSEECVLRAEMGGRVDFRLGEGVGERKGGAAADVLCGFGDGRLLGCLLLGCANPAAAQTQSEEEPGDSNRDNGFLHRGSHTKCPG